MSWSKQELSQFAEAYVTTAMLYDKVVDRNLAYLAASDLSDLPFQECMMALQKYRKNSFNKCWPKPADLRVIVNPKGDSRHVAITLAYAIDKAISKHGWSWEKGYYGLNGNYWKDKDGNTFNTFKDAVISELGEIGWHVICSRGGWNNLCESSRNMEEGIFIAQLRDQAQASITLKDQGIDITKIALPFTEEKDNSLTSTKQIINLITGGKNDGTKPS